MRTRKIFFVTASGGQETDRHYIDTIERKRSPEEIKTFLNDNDYKKLNSYSLGRPYPVWGSVPGSSNVRNWDAMEEGDYILVYRDRKIIFAAEVALKVHNPELARYFWKEMKNGATWEYIYFMINEIPLDLDISKLNKYLGYESDYHPQGFMAIKQETVNKVLLKYGDLISLLQKLQKNEEVEEIDFEKEKLKDNIFEENIEKAPTEHVEMQWRLIRLGKKCKLDVWVPPADQGHTFNNDKFSDYVIPKFVEALDVPKYIKNIDAVWKLAYSVKAAFEIENSTSIYSGILRLSDLKALAPNSPYPLFIVADHSKKGRVFEQLQRPTFSNAYLHLDKAVKFLSYDSIRDLDESKETRIDFDTDWILNKSESVYE